MELQFTLKGKVAIVTGGTGGMGVHFAEALSNAGAETVITDIKPPATPLKGKGGGGKITYIHADVSQKSSVEELVKKALEMYGRLDILMNCAGIIVRKPALETTEKDWDTTIAINMKGLFMFCQAAGTQMIRQKRGKIVNISSLGATYALNDRSVYCTSKAGVSQITRTLALEWGKHGVYVNAIAPGVIRTPMNEAYIETHAKIDEVVGKIPLGRLGKPEDLVGTALFLASDASDYLTGQTVYVDGGYTLGCLVW